MEQGEVLCDALAQAKKRQDGDDNDDQADKVDEVGHELSFPCNKEANRGVRSGTTLSGQIITRLL